MKSLVLTAALLASAPSLDWDEAATQTLEARIADGRYGTVTSVLVMADGDVVYEGYFNGADRDTLHNTRSVTKTMTGMAIGVLAAEGALDIDAPIAPLFEAYQPFENPDPRKDAITARDLLTMSGPLECNDWNSFSRGNEERMYLVEDWSAFFWNLPIRGFPSWETPAADSPHGRAFSYCTAGVDLLGQVIDRVSGVPADRFVEDRLFAPLGIESWNWSRNGLDRAHMGGGLGLTTHGLARFAELQRNGGMAGDQRVLPETWTALAATDHAVIPGSPWRYGFLWWLRAYEGNDGPVESVQMSGNGGNRVVVLPEAGITIVLTKTDYGASGMHQQADDLIATEIVSRLRSR